MTGPEISDEELTRCWRPGSIRTILLFWGIIAVVVAAIFLIEHHSKIR